MFNFLVLHIKIFVAIGLRTLNIRDFDSPTFLQLFAILYSQFYILQQLLSRKQDLLNLNPFLRYIKIFMFHHLFILSTPTIFSIFS